MFGANFVKTRSVARADDGHFLKTTIFGSGWPKMDFLYDHFILITVYVRNKKLLLHIILFYFLQNRLEKNKIILYSEEVFFNFSHTP